MSVRAVMLIAGEPSGDLLAAELAAALTRELGSGLKLFGAGGAHLRAAGADLAVDLTQHAVVGLVEVLRHYRRFKTVFDQLVALALHRRPDVIVCVDFSGFNRRFARQIRWELQVQPVGGWRPRIVQYVSPQVWASRPGRAGAMARDFDLLLAIFPFEKEWYARRAPDLPVAFVGHPMIDRYAALVPGNPPRPDGPPVVTLLPGSRVAELRRHLPVMLEALGLITAAQRDVRGLMVLPNESLAQLARSAAGATTVEIQVGGLADALSRSTVAVASTGTVTLECAYFRVPTVAIYKTSWSTYQIGRRIIRVPYLAMPNLLAGAPLFPELIQQDATAAKLSAAALELLRDEPRRKAIRQQLEKVVLSLGGPGASSRAAQAIAQLLGQPPPARR